VQIHVTGQHHVELTNTAQPGRLVTVRPGSPQQDLNPGLQLILAAVHLADARPSDRRSAGELRDQLTRGINRCVQLVRLEHLIR